MIIGNNWNAKGFWEELNRCIEARGLTMMQVRDATGVSAMTVTRMKSGKRPDLASLSALCAWSGLNAAQFAESVLVAPAVAPGVASEPAVPVVAFGADTLADAIGEMVKAKVKGDAKRYSFHESAMRTQLQALQRQLSVAGRDVLFK